MMNDETVAAAGCAECKGRASLAAPANSSGAPGVDRRAFIARSGLSAAAVLLATACGGAAATGPNVNGPITGVTVNVAAYPALASVGGIARLNSGDGTPIAVVRTGTAAFEAFSLICPHFGCTVGITGSHVGAAFQCPCHGAMFSSTGTWVGGQRTTGLRSLTTAYDATTNTVTIG